MTSDLPDFLQTMLASPPTAGAGVHSWLFRTARQLHAHRAEADIVALLESSVANCGRHVPRSEIEAAVANSLPVAWRPSGASAAVVPRVHVSDDNKAAPPSQPRTPRWPAADEDARSQVIASGFGLVDLWEASPIRMDADGPDTEAIIDALFPGDPLLCIGNSQQAAATFPRSAWAGHLADMQFIVPSPMAAQHGMTKSGKLSHRALSNTGDRSFLVVEFDRGTLDEQAATLSHLSDFGPLVLTVFSGSKSIHGWFFVAGEDDDDARNFFSLAVSLGADPATWTRCQFVRMPGGRRENGIRQTVHFFNPFVLVQ